MWQGVLESVFICGNYFAARLYNLVCLTMILVNKFTSFFPLKVGNFCVIFLILFQERSGSFFLFFLFNKYSFSFCCLLIMFKVSTKDDEVLTIMGFGAGRD